MGQASFGLVGAQRRGEGGGDGVLEARRHGLQRRVGLIHIGRDQRARAVVALLERLRGQRLVERACPGRDGVDHPLLGGGARLVAGRRGRRIALAFQQGQRHFHRRPQRRVGQAGEPRALGLKRVIELLEQGIGRFADAGAGLALASGRGGAALACGDGLGDLLELIEQLGHAFRLVGPEQGSDGVHALADVVGNGRLVGVQLVQPGAQWQEAGLQLFGLGQGPRAGFAARGRLGGARLARGDGVGDLVDLVQQLGHTLGLASAQPGGDVVYALANVGADGRLVGRQLVEPAAQGDEACCQLLQRRHDGGRGRHFLTGLLLGRAGFGAGHRFGFSLSLLAVLAVVILAVFPAYPNLQPQIGLLQQRRLDALGQARRRRLHDEGQRGLLEQAFPSDELQPARLFHLLLEQLAACRRDGAARQQHHGLLAGRRDQGLHDDLAFADLADQRNHLAGQQGGAFLVLVLGLRLLCRLLGLLDQLPGLRLQGFGGVQQLVELVLDLRKQLVAQFLLAPTLRRDLLVDLLDGAFQSGQACIGLGFFALVESLQRLQQRGVVKIERAFLRELRPGGCAQLVGHGGPSRRGGSLRACRAAAGDGGAVWPRLGLLSRILAASDSGREPPRHPCRRQRRSAVLVPAREPQRHQECC